ncbi:MAG: hypothetical protein RRY35_00370, partial [Clostridiales bacterium]
MGKFLKVYKDFSGGLCEDANDNMKDNQLVSAINTVPGERYGLKRAGGTAIAFPAQTPDTGEIKALLDFKPAGQPIQTLCFTGKNFYKWDSTVVQWALIAPLSHPLRDYFVYGGNLYWLNGVDMQIYDGSAVAPAALSNSNPSAELIGRWNK